jgi:hypothetical protein
MDADSAASGGRLKQYYLRHDDPEHAIRISLALLCDTGSVENVGATTTARRSFSAVRPGSSEVLWGLLEDKLLLKSDDTKADVVAAYQQCHRIDPITFPKANVDSQTVRERLTELRTDAFRRRLVYSSPDEPPKFAPAGAAAVAAGSPPGLQRSTSMLGRQVKRAVFTRSDHLFRKEDVVVTCKPRSGMQQGEVAFCSEDLLRYAPFLAVSYHAAVPEPMTHIRRLTLDENDSAWSQIPNMHGAFAVDNVKRFLAFCDCPAMLDNLLNANDRYQKALSDSNQEWDKYILKFEEDKQGRLQQLSQLKETEVSGLRKRFDDALEKDIAILREIYSAHAAREESKLLKRLELQRQAVEQFYERERENTAKIWSKMEDETVIARRNERDAIAETCGDTFGFEHLPRLLMLADTLRCAELRTNCCKLIAINFPKHSVNPQFNTRLIHANCWLELVSFVSDADLVTAYRHAVSASSGGRGSYTGFPLDILKAEYDSRYKIKMDVLRQMDAVELSSLTRRVHHWLRRKGKDLNVHASPSRSGERDEEENTDDSSGVRQEITLLDAVTQTIGKLRLSSNAAAPLFQDGSSLLLQSIAKSNHANVVNASMDLLQGVTEEERYSHWKEALLQALQEKQASYKSTGSSAHLRVVPGFEATTELSLTKKAADATMPFRYACAEGNGCVQIGSSSSKVYFETRVLFVEGGKLYQPNVFVGMNPVPHCLNAVQGTSLAAAIRAETGPGASDGDGGRAQQRRGAATASAVLLSETARIAASANKSLGSRERIVGFYPVDVSSRDEAIALFGFAWTNEGLLYCHGVPIDIRFPYEVGDYVGIAVNLLTGAVKLYRNGESVSVSAPEKSNGPYPQLVHGVSYVPSVAMYSTVLPAVNRLAISNSNQFASGFQIAAGEEEANFAAKIRVGVEFEGKVKYLPLDHVPLAKASTPAVNYLK